MLAQQYINFKKEIQANIIEFIDNEANTEENFENLIKLFKDQNISENMTELQSTLYLLLQISNHHHRFPFFFRKIERILLYFKESIKENYTNCSLFAFFRSNKRILLFLIEEKILVLDSAIVKIIKKDEFNYASYLFPEIKSFLTQKEKIKLKPNDDNFEEKREKGENDDYLCNLIRNDEIDQFITFVNQTNLSLTAKIKASIYETNNFLLSNQDELTLIQYSSFYGSTQIFKYLYLNGVKLEQSIWSYAIHSDNPELIHYLEEINGKMTKKLSAQMLNESIKCHHNEIVDYLFDNYSDLQIESEFIFKYANYSYFPDNLHNEINFTYLCEYNYVSLVNILFKTVSINLKNPNDDVFFLYFFKNSPLIIAEKNGNTEIVRILLNKKNDNEIKIEKILFTNLNLLEEVTIPSSVRKIENFAFYGFKELREVTIPNSVVLIGKSAFDGCSKLKKISIPQSVKRIDDCAFSKCSMLKIIKIPSSVEFIGKSVFMECKKLNKVSILSMISEIQPYSFSGCKLLSQVEVPSSLTLIGKGAFSGCSSLEMISIPSSLISIQDFAFSGCSSLKNINIPPLLVKISSYTFSLCSSLRNVIFEKSSHIKVIEESAFRGCSSLPTISLPDSVVYIGDYAFKGCKSLEKVTNTSSLIYVGEYAFKDCRLLSKILIPNTTEIGKDALKDCRLVEKKIAYTLEKNKP